ncbi:hypothetical protein IEO21_08316 [Rhodonia placenta]|uniref:Uncharacterized protein n=1 Tax=Rhodonia placenta TaxID=104341 RepID=A0A8H7NSV9_9APHY|nr:hypothetical protein IEO21_11149 [Postia placenta]KAF9797883.1 hypothetical protein IEO21_10821 [Postia placenta]KAF9799289.1 hypothetical protein IEO21_10594 [Postia placenta]KAF9800898.1 hypothetical protein IEO21_10261 [Postia placenta]KAF9800901.1 hypothetical protein IEO21_10264 [Postia placenta]
MLKPKARDK